MPIAPIHALIGDGSTFVRVMANPMSFVSRVRDAVWSVYPRLPIMPMLTLSDVLRRSTAIAVMISRIVVAMAPYVPARAWIRPGSSGTWSWLALTHIAIAADVGC